MQRESNEFCCTGNELPEGEPGVMVGEVRYVTFVALEDGVTFSGPVKSPKKDKSNGN